MHGKKDGVVSFALTAAPQHDAVIAGYGVGSPVVIASGAKFTRTRYTNDHGGLYEFISHDYEASSFLLHGHCFPGSDDTGSESGQLFSFACAGTTQMDWGHEVMQFFRDHPLP